jgi:hypothetical protein
LIYYLYNRRTVVDLYSCAHPAGRCTTLLNRIGQREANPVRVAADKDVISYCDNNQVLASNWTLRYITRVVHFFPSPSTNLQAQAVLSPRHWFYNTVLNEHSSQSILDFANYFENIFRQLRDYIQTMLELLFREQRPGMTSSEDHITSVARHQKKAKLT